MRKLLLSSMFLCFALGAFACGGADDGSALGENRDPATTGGVSETEIRAIIARQSPGDVWDLVARTDGSINVITSVPPLPPAVVWHCIGNGVAFVTCTKTFIDGAGRGCAVVKKHTDGTYCTTDC